MAEVLSDAIADVTGVRDGYTEIAQNDGSVEKTEAYKKDTRALQLHDSAVQSYFLKTFGRNARDIACECERSNQPSLVQVLHLSNGTTVNDKLAAKNSRVTKAMATGMSVREMIDEAWLLCLSRVPTAEEIKPIEALITAAATPEDKRLAVEDMYWSLLTSREFLFQH